MTQSPAATGESAIGLGNREGVANLLPDPGVEESPAADEVAADWPRAAGTDPHATRIVAVASTKDDRRFTMSEVNVLELPTDTSVRSVRAVDLDYCFGDIHSHSFPSGSST